MEEKLTQDKIKEFKKDLPKVWEIEDNKELVGKFEFSDFKKAMEFVNDVAKSAEDLNHHPDICIFYNKVHLRLSTHSAGGLTENDFILAKRIGKVYERFLTKR